MKKKKVYVYAICKNEEQFVDRWVDSMQEADAIYVLDTGSTDQTVKKLKKRKVHVAIEEISPWRFDVARNKSLDKVPTNTDICVCTDLDEVFEKGWRKEVEKVWEKDVNRVRYNYNWSFDEEGRPAVNFYTDKIHSRQNYKWTHPVHEILTNLSGSEKMVTTDLITLHHYPDPTKSRGSYLPLLELSVKEDPTNDRNMHYLGREYMYYGKWNEAVETLTKHLLLDKATWKDERSASMRFIAKCYWELEKYEEARTWFLKSIQEAPYLREPSADIGMMEYSLENYEEAVKYCKQALQIPKNTKTYINEPYCYNGSIEEILSICLYAIGNIEEAYEYGKKASLMKPNDERIQKNIIKMEKELL